MLVIMLMMVWFLLVLGGFFISSFGFCWVCNMVVFWDGLLVMVK